jgi:glycosyltransferase involved in cell wall biosynthesis
MFVSHGTLWPLAGGGRVRMGEIVNRALREIRVDLVVVAPERDIIRDAWAVEKHPGLTSHIFPDESTPGAAPARASAPATEAIRQLAAQDGGYDIVHLEGGFLMPVIPPELHPRVVLAEHNVESLLLAQRAAVGQPVSATEIADLRAREKDWWESSGAVVALCPDDADEMRERSPAVKPHTITNGWDNLPAAFSVRADAGILENPILLFFTDYDYDPNKDAVHWLVRDIFPRIRDRVPGAILEMGGMNMTPDIVELGRACPGARVRGFMEDLVAEFNNADIVLNPLRISGGLHLKVIESIRRASLLISSTVGGNRGIPAPLRSAVCYADDPETFAEHVERLCAHPEERLRRRQEMIDHADAAPTWHESVGDLMRVWSQVSRAADERAGY